LTASPAGREAAGLHWQVPAVEQKFDWQFSQSRAICAEVLESAPVQLLTQVEFPPQVAMQVMNPEQPASPTQAVSCEQQFAVMHDAQEAVA
jgi:hypothetical protein